jgi:PDZ domain-containing protein/C2 domain-containing protein
MLLLRAILSRALLAAAAGALLTGCPAVYPELDTRIRHAREGQALDPPPPEGLRWIRFLSAKIPKRRRDGRTWGSAFGKLPDPYAKLLVNDKEVLRSPVESGTLSPTWPGGPKGNVRIGPDDKLRVELWDANPINDKPIGIAELGRPSEDALANQQIVVDFDGGAELTLAFQPAHALIGFGLWYELRSESCFVTRMLEGSPAERAGLVPGDEVVRLGDRDVRGMSPDEIRSAFNGVPASGLPITLKHAGGATLAITLKEGPIYPTYDKFGSVE